MYDLNIIYENFPKLLWRIALKLALFTPFFYLKRQRFITMQSNQVSHIIHADMNGGSTMIVVDVYVVLWIVVNGL